MPVSETFEKRMEVCAMHSGRVVYGANVVLGRDALPLAREADALVARLTRERDEARAEAERLRKDHKTFGAWARSACRALTICEEELAFEAEHSVVKESGERRVVDQARGLIARVMTEYATLSAGQPT